MPTMDETPLDEICRLHVENEGDGRRSLDRAIRIGELLTAQKQLIGHGGFEDWLSEARLPFAPSTARGYMKAYLKRDELKSLNIRDISSALKHIYGSKPKPKPKPKPDDADPLPDEFIVEIRLSKDEEKEFKQIIGKLMELYGTEDVTSTLLRLLRNKYQEHFYGEKNSAANEGAGRVVHSAAGELHRPSSLRSADQRRAG